LNAWAGRSIFQVRALCELFLATLFHYRDQEKFKLHEFVVMPNHAHLLISPSPSVTLERSVQFIKCGFSFRAAKEAKFRGEIWQRGYVDHRIRDCRDYAYHREYIHQNPVRARLALAPEDYRFSSAHPAYSLDAIPQGLKPISLAAVRHD
jgi:putative transposase